MRATRRYALVLGLLAVPLMAETCPESVRPHESAGYQLWTSPQANPIALSPDGAFLYVANTTSNSVSVIDTATLEAREVPVGLDPVSVAVRPDGLEVWVANHVSDSVSVIDTDPTSGTYGEVIATIQKLVNGITFFDEPVGIAFADSSKAYVTLSSRNNISVIDAVTHAISKVVPVASQEPRALAVADGRLFVAAFESGNQTELSACPDPNNITGMTGSPPDCTLSAVDLITFATDPNLPGLDKNIDFDSAIPDRDVYVYSTTDESLLDVVSGVGTLLYGLAADGSGNVFVTQTDALNDVNGLEGQNLVDLGNRIFTNEVARIHCTPGNNCSVTDTYDLEPSFPSGTKFATPYGIAISEDEGVVVATAASSSRVFTLDPNSGAVRDSASLVVAPAEGTIPRGVALRSNGTTGAPETAYVLNTLDNSVRVVDVSDPDAIVLGASIPVGNDPTPDAVRRGRIAFNDAEASTSKTFSCGSCHPDGNTDQLLWRIGGACTFSPCSGDDEPRTTMPVRGLKNTLPLHWDGTLGDPFGGGNGEVGFGGSGGIDCSDTHSCMVDLVEASLSGVMCDQTAACPPGGNELTVQEQDDMAVFLASVSYPPARSRKLDDSLSPLSSPLASASRGFRKFFTDQNGGVTNPDTCADSTAGCHALPLGVATNSSSLNGFDAPTMRGMTDRFVQFSNAITSAREVMEFANVGFPGFVVPTPPSLQWNPAEGFEEIKVFAAAFGAVFTPVYNVTPLDIFQMFEEASTGTSGAVGRQVTLNPGTIGLAETLALLDDLEDADVRGVVNLRGEGVFQGRPMVVSFRAGHPPDPDLYHIDPEIVIPGRWYLRPGNFTRAELESLVQNGDLRVTLTAHLRRNVGQATHPQPLILPTGTGAGATGDPPLPQLTGGDTAITVAGVDVRGDAVIFVDGLPVDGTLSCVSGGSFTPFCDSQTLGIDFAVQPAAGLRLVQLQNAAGPLSPELPICVGAASGCN